MSGGLGGQYLEHLIASVQNEKNHFYMIQLVGKRDWFFFDLENDDRPYRVLWVPYQSPAFKFSSEQAVEEFRAEFISPRRTQILRVER